MRRSIRIYALDRLPGAVGGSRALAGAGELRGLSSAGLRVGADPSASVSVSVSVSVSSFSADFSLAAGGCAPLPARSRIVL